MAKYIGKRDVCPTEDGCLYYPEAIQCAECRKPNFDAWKCTKCGWNPKVYSERIAEIKEKYGTE